LNAYEALLFDFFCGVNSYAQSWVQKVPLRGGTGIDAPEFFVINAKGYVSFVQLTTSYGKLNNLAYKPPH